MTHEQMVEKAEQAIRMLHGLCPHMRHEEVPPRTKSNCILCIAQAAVTAIEKDIK
jgi:hypothetical protein